MKNKLKIKKDFTNNKATADFNEYLSERLSYVFDNNKLYQEDFRRIMKENGGDIDYSFLGFLETYYWLAKIIPKDHIIYDIGNGYGFQAWFFRRHKQYIGINPKIHFRIKDMKYHAMTSQKFFKQYKQTDKKEFAIVNYVPDTETYKLVKKHFQNCYCFYNCIL